MRVTVGAAARRRFRGLVVLALLLFVVVLILIVWFVFGEYLSAPFVSVGVPWTSTSE